MAVEFATRVVAGVLESRVMHLSAIQLLERMASRTAGMVVLDPGTMVHEVDDDMDLHVIDAMSGRLRALANKVFRVLRPGGATIFMGDPQMLAAWEIAAGRAGLDFMAELTVLWDRPSVKTINLESCTMGVRWHIRPGFRHSFNLPASRTLPSNVIVASRVPLHDRYNIMQRPVELTNLLISLLTEVDDLVVDPMCGAGSTLVSAEMCGRRWIGCDIDENQCAIARRRVQRWELEQADLHPLYLWVNGDLQGIEG